MTDKPQADQPRMETFRIPGTKVVTSRIGLGTWAIGGWMWGGTDEAESIRTIHAALDRGITLIDRRRFMVSAAPKRSSARR
jgi:diketogulonate reductase-like aldo/keto reductase